MAQLVDGVDEVEPAQQRIRCDLCRAEDVATAVGLGLPESDELVDAPLGITPDPAVNWGEHPIKPRGTYEGPRRAHRPIRYKSSGEVTIRPDRRRGAGLLSLGRGAGLYCFRGH